MFLSQFDLFCDSVVLITAIFFFLLEEKLKLINTLLETKHRISKKSLFQLITAVFSKNGSDISSSPSVLILKIQRYVAILGRKKTILNGPVNISPPLLSLLVCGGAETWSTVV